MKKYFLLLLLAIVGSTYAQSVNNYKAVIVPVKFEFLKGENDYRLNTMSKFNLKKAGFEAFYSNEATPKAFSERCDLLYFDLQKENGFLITKLFITLKDCNGKIVFQSLTGKSKEKDYQAAYTECLNEAFASIYALQYSYDGTITKKEKEVEGVQEETVVVKEVVVETVPMQEATKVATVQATVDSKNLLYAQPIENGYQLIDSTPKVVMKVIKTSSPSTFIATKGENQGVLVSKNGFWYFEYYQNQQLISEKISVKF